MSSANASESPDLARSSSVSFSVTPTPNLWYTTPRRIVPYQTECPTADPFRSRVVADATPGQKVRQLGMGDGFAIGAPSGVRLTWPEAAANERAGRQYSMRP